MSKSVSIVINTYDRGFCIGRTLESLLRLDYENFEIIVVNGPSTDNTQEVLEAYSDKIRIERCPETNLSMSRNIGICAAAGEIVVFIDDDGMPEPEWLNRLIPAYDDENVAGAGGWVFNHTGYEYQGQYIVSDRIGRSKSYSEFKELDLLNFPYSKNFPGLIGVNSSFRRDRLLEVGGFDEFFIYYLDETDVCLRLVDAGYKIAVVPNAYVHHKGEASLIRNYKLMSRSQVYFALVNSKSTYTKEDALTLLAPEIEDFRVSLKTVHKKGLIDAELLNQHLVSIEEGLNLGIEAANNLEHRNFINVKKALQTSKSQFKRTPRIKAGVDKMIICLLSQDYPPGSCGGIGRWTHELAIELSKRGHDIHVITKSTNKNTVDFEAGVWVHRVMPIAADMSLLPAGIDLPHWIKDHSYAAYKEVQRINSHHKVDLVHSPIYDLEGIFCAASNEFLTVTTLQTTFKTMIESHPEWQRDKNFWNLVVLKMIAGENWLINNAQHILGISQAIVDEMPTYYGTDLTKHDIEVLPLGINDTSKKYKQIRTDQIQKILYVGRLEPRKGIDTLLDTIPDILANHQAVEFIIAGKPAHILANGLNYQQDFIQKHQNATWLQRVKFLGEVSDDTLNQLYADCDIFVAPSRFESFGLIFLEAMRFSTPVIGCNAGGMPEIIQDGVTGYLAEPNSKESLEKTLLKLINNPKLRQEMGQNARKLYQEKFTVVAMADRYEKYFNRLLARETATSIIDFKPNLDASSLLV